MVFFKYLMEIEPNFESTEPNNGDSFEAQFAKREHLNVAGGNAEVLDITPEKLKDETPIFFAPGWGCDIDMYKRATKELSDQDRRIVSMSHPREATDLEAYATEEEMEKYSEGQLRKAYSILGVMEQKNITQVDAIAHSEGAINLTIAAVLHPEKFRNIVYFAPAGLIGKDKFTRLVQGFARQIKRAESLSDYPVSEGEKETAAAAIKSVSSYILENPKRALEETLEISNSQIYDMIRYLHEKGIGIIVMAAQDDPVFPLEKMAKIAELDMMDLLAVTKGGHGAIGDQPELFMREAEDLLSALQWKNNHTVNGEKPDMADYFREQGYA
jgi:pimeloyl-ACP methyl ester carboxylesterase